MIVSRVILVSDIKPLQALNNFHTAAVDSAVAAPALSVVIPAYNEAARISRTLSQCIDYFRTQFTDGAAVELIVVDDGSTDDTIAVVQKYEAAHEQIRLQLVCLPHNQGKGAALRAGVAASTGKWVLLMDADLATPLNQWEALSRAVKAGAQIAIGSRALSTSNVARSQSSMRVLLGRLGNRWIQLLAVPGVHDTQCGFKLFAGDIARDLFARAKEDRFGIDIEVLCRAKRKMGLSVAEVGVEWHHQDGSKVRWGDYLNVLISVPRIVWSVRRSG